MQFDWDPAKAETNLRKHKVSFAEAASIFGDPMALTFADPDHSNDEERWLTFGLSRRHRLLVVSHADRNHSTRIISARQATRHERKIHEET